MAPGITHSFAAVFQVEFGENTVHMVFYVIMRISAISWLLVPVAYTWSTSISRRVKTSRARWACKSLKFLLPAVLPKIR